MQVIFLNLSSCVRKGQIATLPCKFSGEDKQNRIWAITWLHLCWSKGDMHLLFGHVAGLRCRRGAGRPAGTWPGELMTLYYFLLLIESCPTYSSQELIKEEHFCEAKWVSSTDPGCMAVGRAENLSAQGQGKPRAATNKDQIYRGSLFSCTK